MVLSLSLPMHCRRSCERVRNLQSLVGAAQDGSTDLLYTQLSEDGSPNVTRKSKIAPAAACSVDLKGAGRFASTASDKRHAHDRAPNYDYICDATVGFLHYAKPSGISLALCVLVERGGGGGACGRRPSSMTKDHPAASNRGLRGLHAGVWVPATPPGPTTAHPQPCHKYEYIVGTSFWHHTEPKRGKYSKWTSTEFYDRYAHRYDPPYPTSISSHQSLWWGVPRLPVTGSMPTPIMNI